VAVPEIILTGREQAALRSLMASEPVPGRPLPPSHVLELFARLVPCDAVGALLAENAGGAVIDEVDQPRGYSYELSSTVTCEGPYKIGLIHWSRDPEGMVALPLDGLADSLSIGFRNGPDHVATLWMDRTRTRFSDRDLALAAMVAPALRRLMRQRLTPQLPSTVTPQERRVLMCVAAGHSNLIIAEDLGVAVSTVRKHLEHVYRKLGVTSRLAAVVALQGRDLPDLDLRERIETYA
jgi:DNA-binding CsgD family transcriptional regulator